MDPDPEGPTNPDPNTAVKFPLKQLTLNGICRKRQTMLFSATTTKKTEDLIAVALKKEPIYIGIEEKNAV